MIERFNFFDLYGYLLPGGFLLLLLWLPFGLVSGKWPSELGAAILGLGLAYIAGHLLRIMSEPVFPSEFKDAKGTKRKPSDLLLDKDGDERLPRASRVRALKANLQNLIKSQFDIPINVDETLGWAGLEKESKNERNSSEKAELDANIKKQQEEAARRNLAFLQCRKYLVQNKAAAYAEQFQGMYEMLRGVAAALGLASGLYLGLGIGLTISRPQSWLADLAANLPGNLGAISTPITLSVYVFAIVEVVAALCSFRVGSETAETARRVAFYTMIGLLISGGAIVGAAKGAAPLGKLDLYFSGYENDALLVIAIVALALSLLSAAASRAFAATFAATVYREFNVVAKSIAPSAPAGSLPAR